MFSTYASTTAFASAGSPSTTVAMGTFTNPPQVGDLIVGTLGTQATFSGATGSAADNSAQAGTANSYTTQLYGTNTFLGFLYWCIVTRPFAVTDQVTVTSNQTMDNRAGMSFCFRSNTGGIANDYTGTPYSTTGSTFATSTSGFTRGQILVVHSLGANADTGSSVAFTGFSLGSGNQGQTGSVTNNTSFVFSYALGTKGPAAVSETLTSAAAAVNGGGGVINAWRDNSPKEQNFYTKSKGVIYG